MMGLGQFLICIVGNLLNLCSSCVVRGLLNIMYDVARLNFFISSTPKSSFVHNLSRVFLSEHNVVCNIYAKYSIVLCAIPYFA